jgi:isopenicillin-N epimerase
MTLASHWTLDPEITFLNHGSYGACPKAVLEAQSEWRARLERQPVTFFTRELEALLAKAREPVAQFVGTDPDRMAFVANATTGINAVLRSLDFSPGDELLVTNHEYNASRNVINFVAEKSGATVVVVDVPFPLYGPDDVVQAILAKTTPRTKLLLVDQVTSQTALVLPVEKIVAEMRKRGVETLVDGAHAPGMLPLNIDAIGAAWYTGNCHKWICAPKGAAILVARKDKLDGLRPTTISHGANAPLLGRSLFRVEFDWMGTLDPTPWLTVPDAIRIMASLVPGGWPEIMKRNHDLAVKGRRVIALNLKVDLPCPESMLGSMAALPISPTPKIADRPPFVDGLQDALMDRYRIELPVIYWPEKPKRVVRISAQLYNRLDEYERLADALVACLRAE